MWNRNKTGSVVCRSCGLLVGVNDESCFNCGASNPSLWGLAPVLRRMGSDLGFTTTVTLGCISLYLLALALDPRGIGGGGMLGFLSPSGRASFLLGSSGAVPVFQLGRYWTVLSAGWLHGSLLHIGFNLMWIRQLAPATASVYGPGKMILIYTAGSIVGFSASSWMGALIGSGGLIGGAAFTLGASAPIFGLLGALVYSGRRGGSSMVSNQAKTYALVLFVFGFLLPGVDNWAHAGGFVGGYLAGQLLDPLKPERLNHIIGALVCLGLTALSIILSIITGLPIWRS